MTVYVLEAGEKHEARRVVAIFRHLRTAKYALNKKAPLGPSWTGDEESRTSIDNWGGIDQVRISRWRLIPSREEAERLFP